MESLLGSGAMGEVWQARDTFAEQAGDRQVRLAIKLLNVDLRGQLKADSALQREASRAQRLAHPNICTVYTFDRDERTGEAFIAMELMDGKPLDEVIRADYPAGMPPAEALPLIRGMAGGLAYAHRNGIVHADFKPSNVFVVRGGTAKVLDFGISRVVQIAGAAGDLPIRDDSVFTGYTAAYAAPEAIRTRDPSPADDVYSLGVVAYELLTGRHPFGRASGGDARETSLTPPAIPGLGRREWAVIRRAMALDRAARFPDAGAFLGALEGRRKLQLVLASVALAALGVAGYLGYENFQSRQPAVPFSGLPLETRELVDAALRQGAEALTYLTATGDISASADAADHFAEAYALHPRNPDAVAGLKEAAGYAVDWYRSQGGADAVAELRTFQARSEFYRTYGPIVETINRLEGR